MTNDKTRSIIMISKRYHANKFGKGAIMQEKILTNKKRGMQVLLICVLLEVAGLALAIYGGIIGGLIMAFIVCKKEKINITYNKLEKEP